MPSSPRRALIVEDSEDDTLLPVKQLLQGGFVTEYMRVETAETRRQRLEQGVWDIVFADFTMPRCDTSPSASFGSNQVDLGDMTSPASATRIKSAKVHCANPGAIIGAMDFNGAWIEVGKIVKAQAISPESTHRSSFFGCMDKTPIPLTIDIDIGIILKTRLPDSLPVGWHECRKRRTRPPWSTSKCTY